MLFFLRRGVIDVIRGTYVMADPFFARFVRERSYAAAKLRLRKPRGYDAARLAGASLFQDDETPLGPRLKLAFNGAASS